MQPATTIDFEPASIAAILRRDEQLVIVFPQQVMFGRNEEELPSSYPLMLCEMRLSGGMANPDLPEMPLAIDNIRVVYRGGERRYFLPTNFREEGPSRVYGEVGETFLLLAEGGTVSLEVIRQVGTAPVTYENGSEGGRSDA